MERGVAIDFETYLISATSPTPKAVCLSYYTGSKSGLLIGLDEMEPFLLALLKSDLNIIAHNSKFELLVIYH